jgi:cell division protein FtsW (lipid II flippase)
VVGTVASLGAVLAAVDTQRALAIHLTVAGALVTASALIHPTRRILAWPGGLLLAMATWVRLAELGVTVPEAYTLPSALVLTTVGCWRLLRDDRTATLRMLAPGLFLATVPSLLTVLDDPTSLRALLLGLGCLALVLAGVVLRWSAPLVVGAVVGAILVLRELAPYAADLPSWVVIGLSGTVLLVVGVTWESRMRDVRTASRYVARLR